MLAIRTLLLKLTLVYLREYVKRLLQLYEGKPYHLNCTLQGIQSRRVGSEIGQELIYTIFLAVVTSNLSNHLPTIVL